MEYSHACTPTRARACEYSILMMYILFMITVRILPLVVIYFLTCIGGSLFGETHRELQ